MRGCLLQLPSSEDLLAGKFLARDEQRGIAAGTLGDRTANGADEDAVVERIQRVNAAGAEVDVWLCICDRSGCGWAWLASASGGIPKRCSRCKIRTWNTMPKWFKAESAESRLGVAERIIPMQHAIETEMVADPEGDPEVLANQRKLAEMMKRGVVRRGI